MLAGVVAAVLAAAPGLGTGFADVFRSGTEGYACFRIPVFVRLPNGDIALFAEGRKLNCDDQGAWGAPCVPHAFSK